MQDIVLSKDGSLFDHVALREGRLEGRGGGGVFL